MKLYCSALLWLALISFVRTKCYDPSPAFPVPLWTNGRKDLQSVFNTITSKVKTVVNDAKFDKSSYSIEITSNTETLWSTFHTARKQNANRPGVKEVDGDSLYRIASITKTFTTLAILQQQKAGNLSLDDTVDQWISELAGPDSGELPWKDITLRILASQLSGIPREFAQADLINSLPDPIEFGLPPATKEGLPRCYQYANHTPCTRKELLEDMKTRKPIYAPNFKSTYSNVAFEVLGLVIENVTGMNYSDYIRQAIFEPLQMNSSSLEKPGDDHAVLPDGENFWDIDEGVQAPTGGIYSSSLDMSKFVRYILTHYNALATGVNWMNPASWATGMNSFYGMPFEIFRTERLLENSDRPVTFITKAGGVPAYFSRISVMPEYGLGLTILVGGDSSLLDKIQEIVTVDLIRAAENLIWQDVGKTYSGTYTSINDSLNSSLVLGASAASGLTVKSFISNSTDVFTTLIPMLGNVRSEGQDLRVQLSPTLLYKNESTQSGEIWRVEVVSNWSGKEESRSIWDDFCSTDIDPASYAGVPLTEVIFWHEEDIVELPAWKVKMRRSKEHSDGEQTLLVQS